MNVKPLPFHPALPWPVHPQPFKDETLVSWMHRLAAALGTTFHGLCSAAWEGRKVAHLLLDRMAPDWVLDTLSHLAIQPNERVFDLTLVSLEGKLYTGTNQGRIRWVLPHAKGSHGSGGQQFCPECLAEDKHPHFRLSWRLGFVATCLKHQRTLMSACPACSNPINLSGWIPEGAFPQDDLPLTACRTCGFDLRTSPKEPTSRPTLPKSVTKLGQMLQIRMLQGMRDGWMEVEGHGFMQSHLVLDGVHQMLKLLGGQRSGLKLGKVIQRILRIEDPGLFLKAWPKGQSFEFLPAARREGMLAIAAWLLEEWPTRFVMVCTEAEVWSNHILQDRNGNTPYRFLKGRKEAEDWSNDDQEDCSPSTPYWLAKVANEELKILHTEWRAPGEKGMKRAVDSYGRLGDLVMSSRLRHRAEKIKFIREHPEWANEPSTLATALQQAGYYSAGSSLAAIRKNLPKLIEAAKAPGSVDHTHGLPLAGESQGVPYNHPRGRAFMSPEDELRLKAALLERQAEGTPITIHNVKSYLKFMNGPTYTNGSIYRVLRRLGLKTNRAQLHTDIVLNAHQSVF